MIIEFNCHSCDRRSSFDTSEGVMMLVEKAAVRKQDVYVVNCTHCGRENRIRVDVEEFQEE